MRHQRRRCFQTSNELAKSLLEPNSNPRTRYNLPRVAAVFACTQALVHAFPRVLLLLVFSPSNYGCSWNKILYRRRRERHCDQPARFLSSSRHERVSLLRVALSRSASCRIDASLRVRSIRVEHFECLHPQRVVVPSPLCRCNISSLFYVALSREKRSNKWNKLYQIAFRETIERNRKTEDEICRWQMEERRSFPIFIYLVGRTLIVALRRERWTRENILLEIQYKGPVRMDWLRPSISIFVLDTFQNSNADLVASGQTRTRINTVFVRFGCFFTRQRNERNKTIIAQTVTWITRCDHSSFASTLNTLITTPKSQVSPRTPREYFYYSKHIMAK